jgi:hypothetical protein
MSVTLPVSVGEALDKLTILDIKCDKIQDERKKDCVVERDTLLKDLQSYIDRFPWHYKILKEVNLTIWNLQDGFHGKDITEVRAGQICTEILKENDRRFRVKAKINHLLSSTLREQKGYAKKKAFFYGHLGLGDMFWMCGAVRYLATCYDEVVVVCKDKYVKNVEQMYNDDPTIKIYAILDDYILQPFQTVAKPNIESNLGMTVYACGYHSANPRIYEFPLCFYDDLNLPRSVRSDYFYVPTTQAAVALYHEIRPIKYFVVHQQSQNKTLPIWDSLFKQRPDVLILDLNKNHYEPTSPFYHRAEIVVNKPLLDYKLLLENANEIHLLESSVYCFASHLDLSKVNVKMCYDSFDNSNERIAVFKSATI